VTPVRLNYTTQCDSGLTLGILVALSKLHIEDSRDNGNPLPGWGTHRSIRQYLAVDRRSVERLIGPDPGELAPSRIGDWVSRRRGRNLGVALLWRAVVVTRRFRGRSAGWRGMVANASAWQLLVKRGGWESSGGFFWRPWLRRGLSGLARTVRRVFCLAVVVCRGGRKSSEHVFVVNGGRG
jgi:hypothetical protein